MPSSPESGSKTESSSSPLSLPQLRERVIAQLTEAFAHDVISVEELELRLEQVYRAQSAAETEAIVVDLRLASPPPPGPNQGVVHRRSEALEPIAAADRFVAVLSSSSRRGPWAVPHRLEAVALMSDSVVDLTNALLPGDIVDIHVRIVMANMRIVVPARLRVVNRVGAFLANVETDASLDLAPMIPGSPVIRITGYATLANLEIVAGPSATAAVVLP